MPNLRIIDDSITADLSDISICFNKIWGELKDSVSVIDANSAISQRSTTFKGQIKDRTEKLKGFQWIPRSRDVQAQFQIDAQYHCDNKCGTEHIVNFVLCLNNREAIGTNFLKLEIAALKEIRLATKYELTDDNILGIIISLDRDLLDKGGWDPAYADASEYSNAGKTFYRQLLKSNVISMRIHSF